VAKKIAIEIPADPVHDIDGFLSENGRTLYLNVGIWLVDGQRLYDCRKIYFRRPVEHGGKEMQPPVELSGMSWKLAT
jgi:hypothetical protein